MPVFQGTLQSDGEAGETIFKDVIGHAVLGAFDGGLLRERAGDQEKGSVVAGLTEVGQGVKAGPAGQRVSSQDNSKVLRAERGFKVAALVDDRGLHGNASVAEFAENGGGIVGRMLEQ